MGGPERIPNNFVKTDSATVLDKGGLWRELLAHPGDVQEPSTQVGSCDGGEGLAGLRIVNHQRDLVTTLAFIEAGAEIEVMVAVIHVKRRFDIVLSEVNAIRAVSVNRVLDVAAPLDFPAAVDIATAAQEA